MITHAHIGLVSPLLYVLCNRDRLIDPPGPGAGVRRPGQPRALSRKVSDEYAVPLCRSHHRALHRRGNEAGWWREAGIDPIKTVRKLWRKTRLNGGRTAPAEGAMNAADQPACATRA